MKTAKEAALWTGMTLTGEALARERKRIRSSKWRSSGRKKNQKINKRT